MSETAVVAIVGIAATLFVSGYVARTQRLTAREDRLWTRRAATYVDLADWILREGQAAQLRFAKIRTGVEELMMPDALPDSAWWGMHARVIAFGTSNVRAVVDKLLHQRAAFASALAHALLSSPEKMTVPIEDRIDARVARPCGDLVR